jgi:hypothetical protein
MPSYYDSKSSKPKSGKVKKYKTGRSVSARGDDSITPGWSSKAATRRAEKRREKKEAEKFFSSWPQLAEASPKVKKTTRKMAAGGQVPKTVARGSGAARTQYFRKNG